MSTAPPEPLAFVPDIGPLGSVPLRPYAPLRSIADIEALEGVPIEQRITRWDFGLNLLDGCRNEPRKPALHATRNGEVDGPLVSWSFAELERHSFRIANLLRARGVGPDAVVAIVTPTLPALYASLIAGFLAGRPFPINWMLDAPSLGDLIERSQASVVIALGPTPGFSIWENVAGAIARLDHPPHVFSLHDPFAPAHPADLMNAAAAFRGDELTFARPTKQRDSIAAYVHSGGTTGHPKIVKVTHGGLVYRQWATNLGLALTPADVTLSDTPLFHIGGLCARGLVPTANGMTTIIPSLHGARDKTYMGHYWRYVERFGITQLSGVPTTLSVLVKNPPTSENISSLRPYFGTGSTAMAPAVQEKIGAITGARVLQTYGLTENTSNACIDPRDGEGRPGASGLRVPYTTVRVVRLDDDGAVLRDCDYNENGMVVVSGPGISAGYLDPAQNGRLFLADGSFVTGDLGSLDAAGYLRISGRQKDLIIRSGHNIEPRLIEDALAQSPFVALVAAVAKPDAHAGELPIAYVELHPGAQVTEAELLRFAAERIGERPAVPKEIILIDKLPLTAVGKPIKHLLQVDAARRVFNDVLQAVPGEWTLDVTNTGGSGLTLTVTLAGRTAGAREKAEAILSTFSVPFVVEEQAP